MDAAASPATVCQPLKVLIDATGITRQKAGVGVYARNLIDNLSVTASDIEFYVLAQDDDGEMDFSARPNVTMLWVPAVWFRRLPLRFLLEQLYLPWLLWRRGLDVLHSLHYAFPLLPSGARRVVTLHDMTFFTMPHVHLTIKVVYFRFFMRAAVRFADAIVFISSSAEQDCIALLGGPRGRHIVIPHGRDEAMQPVPRTAAQSGSSLDRLREKYHLPERFVLYIGTLEPRKNLERLLEAFARIAARDRTIGLVLAGNIGWRMGTFAATITRLGLSSRVVLTGFILEEEKPVLLSGCALFVYPSLYEGFGLPLLEALACGAPTITSNISSLPEVAGDAAVLIDPTDCDALEAAMDSVLSDSGLREQLRSKGLLQAGRFSWKKTAAATAGLYRSIAREHRRG